MSVVVAELYFGGLRGMIGSSPFRYVMKTIVFCGEWPYSAEALLRLVPRPSTIYSQDAVPPETLADTVIVGQLNASRSCMAQLLDEAALRQATPPRFIPQEGFLDELLFGHDWWSSYPYLLNAALSYHQGLRIAHDLHVAGAPFAWPSIEAEETTGEGVVLDADGFAPETALHALGYRITGLSRESRWTVLVQAAIPRLGLPLVVEIIASHVRLRKAQHDGRWRFRHAIAEWEHDLSRLKAEYWLKLAYRFAWPSVEPEG